MQARPDSQKITRRGATSNIGGGELVGGLAALSAIVMWCRTSFWRQKARSSEGPLRGNVAVERRERVDQGRGRLANTPSKIPERGWKWNLSGFTGKCL